MALHQNKETTGAHCKFPLFDVVTDESDHYYKDKNSNNCSSNPSSQVHRTIMREWKILKQNLPDSIYVRVYENRIDLLRALIMGPAGTPYHDGLFVFDIAFPKDYPKSPPKVHYRSYGHRINPNLYESGYVCLSIINTWSGKGNEKWVPDVSTVLQILVSIQGLVLNAKPYFNEPLRLSNSDAAADSYNESAFILSCKTMINLLSTPPKNFEALVAAHFRERAHNILTACIAYMDGEVKIGHYGTDTSKVGSIRVSRKFKDSMVNVYERLVDAFTRNGSDLGLFIKVLEELKHEKELLKLKHEIQELWMLLVVLILLNSLVLYYFYRYIMIYC